MKVFSFTIKNTWLHHAEHGWGNGYVAVPPGHPLYGKHYQDKIPVKNLEQIRFNGDYLGLLSMIGKDFKDGIQLSLIVDVHAGITLSEPISTFRNKPKRIPNNYWVFGFDTCHSGDGMTNWTKEAVIKETRKFKKIIKNINEIIEEGGANEIK